ncbi:hypothetical protein CY34DRAFT_664593 [Suillus luteus UH-Slu-Lm8-n1]|uniref:Uncharacterized protein n=1 Tax=Suillus luteus UH-Slu-Lm8-n1 TaxID=930992 RepID=A0A0D0BL87_9AGAM|nr:hypothetical protein CY34DRAFT_664593 [Suillus luteus UH-Slu-Lm8-n1]
MSNYAEEKEIHTTGILALSPQKLMNTLCTLRYARLLKEACAETDSRLLPTIDVSTSLCSMRTILADLIACRNVACQIEGSRVSPGNDRCVWYFPANVHLILFLFGPPVLYSHCDIVSILLPSTGARTREIECLQSLC